MAVELEDQLPPVSEKEVDALEEQFGIKLPSDYRRFLLTQNGGDPPWPNSYTRKIVPGEEDFVAGGTEIVFGPVQTFLGVRLDDDHYMSLAAEIDYYRGDRMPMDLIPIAFNGCGDWFCLCVEGDKAGHIFFWDSAEEAAATEPPGEVNYDNVQWVCGSFDEFFNGLASEDE